MVVFLQQSCTALGQRMPVTLTKPFAQRHQLIAHQLRPSVTACAVQLRHGRSFCRKGIENLGIQNIFRLPL
ncbi:hypothetical protein IX296_003105 [Bacteroides pyogenes]|nr:hypothetical protein [Bacteroides pyogenes]MBR8740096.1 hypothetical protein [Bacteroides pyogenes]MBR8755829.1 hypothetical protein [Bacteroides pyogenes]MBR8797147.1 hypothetical protein [Bacteroides pyogenes]MBR8810782.1 hypothetical protein [Bacteroides pyogenes]